ncbi:unnamed protein product [Adineta ricciae]|uniref:Reverse transcriptase domain-containing protein n=1 Tax=Adineta ricciae TaxID=249248 RepID=A0A815UHU7_ADIRI|nr:unnamed protein product [Adineta ricciae]CAF1516132.1 unnamed protein product [Adineta ricciae]
MEDVNQLKDENIRQSYHATLLNSIKGMGPTCSFEEHSNKIGQTIKNATKDDIKDRLTQYCSSLYKGPGGGDEVVEELEGIAPLIVERTNDIVYSEVQTATRALKRNKSPGSHGIPAEMLQARGESIAREIYQLYNKAWREDTILEEWGKSILVPLPKKEILATVLIIKRSHLSVIQEKLLAKKAKRQGKKIYNCFTDFQKAFDTNKHKIIWPTLKSYGADTKIITPPQNICEKSQSAVRIGNNYGGWFQTDVGTRQGDPLSLLLFIVYLERVMDQVKQNTCGNNVSGILISKLRFADGIAFINEDLSSLQH